MSEPKIRKNQLQAALRANLRRRKASPEPIALKDEDAQPTTPAHVDKE